MTRSPLRALAALLAAGVAGALLNTVPAASVAAPGGPGPVGPVTEVATSPAEPARAGAAGGRPQVGDCHALTYAEFLAVDDPDPKVRCNGRHTSRTFAVPTAPRRVDFTDGVALGRFLDRTCGRAFKRAVNRDIRKRLVSAYFGYAFFLPTQAQQDDGARWVRCDLVLAGGSRKLAPLPRKVRVPAIRSFNPPDAEARCLTGTGAYTVCSRRHAYRASTAYRMPGKAYPSDGAFRRVARSRCGAAAETRRFTYVKPTREQWRGGFRHVVCYDVTRR